MFEYLAHRFSLVLDISGSMNGPPIQTGLLYMVLMAKVFRINQLFYFESELHQVNLTNLDFDSSICQLVKKVYKETTGSTCLQSVFDYFRTNNVTNKNVIIITDGDCDPSHDYSVISNPNPFHTAPKSEQGLKYIVVNVKETKMNFPYLGMDPDVCYVTGNNPKTLNGLIKALVISLMESIPITPSLVLKCSLDLDELTHSFQLGTFSKEFTITEITKLFQIFICNLAPKRVLDQDNLNRINLDNGSDNGLDNGSDYVGW